MEPKRHLTLGHLQQHTEILIAIKNNQHKPIQYEKEIHFGAFMNFDIRAKYSKCYTRDAKLGREQVEAHLFGGILGVKICVT